MMKGIPYSVVAASTIAISQLAHAGVKLDNEYNKEKVDDLMVNDIIGALNATESESEFFVDRDIAEMFAVDGKIEGLDIEAFLANNQFEATAGSTAQCCHSNCHTNCHNNCHGSRSWR
ncbi:hypothetical protein ACXHQ0_19615 [Vibrio antiquarius]|uniref:Uncharacterized protein n=1 Tax=Vibrio parahaemolyticus TaxID=670 RepID=A0AA46Z582_VIBPH|nr:MULTISPECIES: hypothetical protein [Vibrio harveyi group]EGR5927972.1 hypothetical protein [Vibrio parahaemolyticus]EJG0181190.1 hypothetical protein [Vibrio parahaemolyticus]KOE91383.1 hypothetical protein ACS91_06440 [Vibrio parahaemolyticus]MCS0114739.1 hypothetical protein [Vibrio parahaemolyticus]MCS0314068.1 hypothetical protein [Vibrio diabolicus]